MKKENKNVIFVDILRIIGCILVLLCHCKFSLPGNNTKISRIVVACLSADGVAIFWIIMGMFYFRNISYKERLSKMLKKIIIPIIVLSIIIFYFNGFLLGEVSIINSIKHPFNDYILLFKRILNWEPIDYLGHLWYLYIYILLIVLYPILNKIREYIDLLDYKKVLLFFWTILLINDLSLNKLLEFSHHAFNGVFAALPFFFTGYILYKNNKKIEDKSIIKYFLIIIGISVIRTICTYFVMKNDPNNRELLRWYSNFGLVVSVSLYFITRSISYKIKINNTCAIIIKHFSKVTFYIYLIHNVLINIFTSRGYSTFLLERINNKGIYLIVFSLIILILSFILSEIVLLICKLFNTKKNLTTKIKN